MNYFVYKFIGKEGDVLYVGQTVDIDRRMSEHKGRQWDIEKDHIEYAMCKNQVDMCLYEMYYINKLHAKYNDALVYNEEPTFELPELEFQIYKGSFIEAQHDKVMNDTKKDFVQRFDIGKFWTDKMDKIEKEIEETSPDDERYDELIRQKKECELHLEKIDKMNEEER